MTTESKSNTPTKEYGCTLTLPKGLVKMHTDGKVEFVGQKLTAEEVAVVATMSQCLERLRNGRLCEFELKPNSYDNVNAVIKGEWLRSGRLRNRGVAKIMYNYVTTANEALESKGVFTCTEGLFKSLPKKREAATEKERTANEQPAKATA